MSQERMDRIAAAAFKAQNIATLLIWADDAALKRVSSRPWNRNSGDDADDRANDLRSRQRQ